MEPTATVPGPVLGSQGEACARCGAQLAADQRYCLNCGTRRADMRLAFLEMARAAPAPGPAPARFLGDGDGARSPLAALGALIALLLALGIGVLLGRGGDDPAPAAAGPAAVVTVAAPAAVPSATATPAVFVSDWPVGTTGFTVMLRSLPATATADEVARAKQQATSQGASPVGALRSDEYPSLPAGQFVVYSGTFTDRAGAQSALKGLRASFAEAKVVRVAGTAAGAASGSAGAAPDTTTTPKSGGLSTKEYQQRSKKIPDEVQSKGTPPPADGAAPGDGSGATEIG